MNTMGKILVFLVLVFALVIGGLQIVVEFTRKNWKEAYEQLKRDREVLIANYNTTKETMQKRHLENVTLHQKVNDLKNQFADAKKDYQQKVGNLDGKMQTAKVNQDQLATTSLQFEETLKTLRQEVSALKKVIERKDTMLVKLDEEKDKNFQIAIRAQNENNATQDRNRQLLKRIQELELRIARMQTSGSDGAPSKANVRNSSKPNPPPQYVKGIIEKVDATDKSFVQISIGSDAGLRVNNTLEAYRLRPRPQYLGMIRIVEVEPHKAVGRLIRSGDIYATQPSLRVGDEVASKIMAR